ncbi:MAG TPA: serine hydrolase domain-containing protein [Gemmatimonadales bacterium]|nr:serine hydrolase domain-containing protein [Gemmatimonadales bacterium]
MTSILLLLTALAGGDDKAAARTRAIDFSRVDAAVVEGIRRGVYPGAVVVIGTSERILHAQRYGHFTWSSRSPRPRSDSTLWDLASLTKVIGTTGSVLRLVDRGEMELDAPVRRYLPGFSGGAKDRVTIRMLLNHTSGMRPYLPLYRTASSREMAITQVLADTLLRAPGDTAVYSDLNAIILGLAVEAVAGMPLDSVVQREVLEPLAMRQTMFRPRPSLWERTAPSSMFNRSPVAGLVNDRNAVTLGGVAGHAGLFGTGQDLARFAQAWLSEGELPGGGRWVRAETLREFLIPSRHAGSRLLGWDSPDEEPKHDSSVFGSLLSPLAYGHTGWTGTEVWIDPARDLFVVFLTNRSFDPRARNSLVALRDVRARVSDAAAALFPAQCTLARAPVRGREEAGLGTC